MCRESWKWTGGRETRITLIFTNGIEQEEGTERGGNREIHEIREKGLLIGNWGAVMAGDTDYTNSHGWKLNRREGRERRMQAGQILARASILEL